MKYAFIFDVNHSKTQLKISCLPTFILCIGILGLTLLGCDQSDSQQETLPNFGEWLNKTENASRWLELMEASDLELISSDSKDTFTFLVPTNESLTDIEDLEEWSKDVTRLNTVIKRHILIGDIPFNQLAIQPHVQTRSSEESVSSLFQDGQTWIGGRVVFDGDIPIAQGRVHRIEGLILSNAEQIENEPPSLADLVEADDTLSTFYALLQLTGLIPALDEGSFTLFAPSNEVFDSFKDELGQEKWDELLGDVNALTRILTPHLKSGPALERESFRRLNTLKLGQEEYEVVFSGEILQVGDVRILDDERRAQNGLLYLVDDLWIKPQQQQQEMQQQEELDLVELLQNRDDLSVFTSMIDQGGLTQSLKDPGPFTLFVPTNAAFAGLIDTIGQEAYENLFIDPQTLIALLNAHIVAGVSWPKSTLLQGGELTTLSGLITFGSSPEGRLILGRHVVQILESDLNCTNGLIHVIDGVLSEALLTSK